MHRCADTDSLVHHSTCEEVGIDGAGRYARKKTLVKQFRCPKTCPTMGSECPETYDFLSTGRQDSFGGKPAQGREKLTASPNKYDTGVSFSRRQPWTQSTARDEHPIFPAVSSRGRKSVMRAPHHCNENSLVHFVPSNGAGMQVTKWNCFVSVRPIHSSFA